MPRSLTRRPVAHWFPREAWAVDIGIALLVQAAVTMPFVVPRSAELPPATWAAYGLTTLAVLPLVARRRAPVAVLMAVLAAGVLYRFGVCPTPRCVCMRRVSPPGSARG